ncbi:ATP-dependent nuclease [Neisseria animaloris]|uniref:Predicted ATP-binding protein involved in virulence n=1 Tax=Neisseria animaloris TaxID=326522 RepID=A0A448UDL3_9NEIS|nr:AAA family ATPase [Neisseria animaloris]VEJ21999.1 Predicted ATP-binding protein involved in virulence [Neisseria animaloris]
MSKSHLVRMHIKNLGCIGNEGLTIELDDIVCLVGANNSGKTTVLRAYELAVNQEKLRADDFHKEANGNPATVELWVHIPENAGNIDDKWKEKTTDGLLLVRSKWEWNGLDKPKRTTWNPELQEYSEDEKASGLDAVFSSRLPKPFRIGSLDNPEDEHKKLLSLALEPILKEYKFLIEDEASDFSKKLLELKESAREPINKLNRQIESTQEKINSSYRKIFSSSEVKLTVSIGDLGFNLQKALTDNSRIDVSERNSLSRWDMQGTGAQRALFWSILQVRSELNREYEAEKLRGKLKIDLEKLQSKSKKTTADERKIQTLIEQLSEGNDDSDVFLPGYMLLIDEPETALHPSAIRAAKEHLYSLASEAGWQVMLSTHNPIFIDPLADHTTIVRLHRTEESFSPNTYRTEAIEFSDSEKDNLKALMLFDTNLSEMFFGNKVLIVEGDTEFAAFSEIMRRDPEKYPINKRPLIVRARGKATIAILVKMLAHFKINFSVLHDIDSPRNKEGKSNPAYSINKNIAEVIRNAKSKGLKIIHRCSCPNFEEHHQMKLPNKDKPFESWKAVKENSEICLSVESMLDQLIDESTDIQEKDGSNYEEILKDWIGDNGNEDIRYKFS